MSCYNVLVDIQEDFKNLTREPEKENLTVLLLHDVTGIKKKDIKKILEYGPQLYEIYSKNQDFTVNKKPSAKLVTGQKKPKK